MNRTTCRVLVIAIVAIVPPELTAQNPQDPPPLITRTIALRHLRAADAARLVSPYVRSPRGGVYDGGVVQAVTVVETAPTVAVIDSILRENDRSPAVLTFRFQLIAADDTPGRDPAIDELDAALRGLFRFKGYHLIGEGTASAQTGESFSLTMSGGENRFALAGEAIAVEAVTGGSVHLRIRLEQSAGMYEGKPAKGESLMTTGLTVPLGQTVVLGSAAPGGKNVALILAVRPTVALPPRR